MSCGHRSELERWVRAGGAAPMPAALAAHLAGCPACARDAQEVTGPRAWLVDLPVHEIPERRLGEMRFALMGEARRARGSRPAARSGRRRAAWAVGIGIAAAATLSLVWWPGAPNAEPGTRQPKVAAAGHAVVEVDGDARVLRVRPAPDEVYRLFEGGAWFRVSALHEGERFRVLAGDGTVEVRGTRFHLEVRDDLLIAARVAEGRVLVRLDGREVADLEGGQAWRRPPPGDRAEATAGEEPVAGAVGMGSPAGRVTAAPQTARPHSERGPRRETARHTSGTADDDAAFRHAWRLLRAGDHRRAAAALDALAARTGLDPERRADILFWAAQAHLAAGAPAAAEIRARAALAAAPGGFRAEDAAELLLDLRAARSGGTVGPEAVVPETGDGVPGR